MSLPGYRHVKNADVRAIFERPGAWRSTPSRACASPTCWTPPWRGSFKGLYCQGEDILQSDPDTKHVAAGLAAMECVIVHDLFLNETANYAHVFLPGSTFLEKDGTFTNAERRINRVRKVMAPKNGYADWEITQMLAQAMGADWHYTHPAQIMEEIAATTPSFTGVTYDLLEEVGLGPVALQRGQSRRLADHACGRLRARQGAVHRHRIRGDGREDRPALPALLTTGRILSQYNVGAQTRRTENTVWHKEDVLEIHPHDAELRGVKEGDWVKLASRSGETALRATLTDRVSPGVVYTTFHHPGTQANVITTDYSDWATNCPEYKVTAVQVSLSNGPTEWQKDYAEQANARGASFRRRNEGRGRISRASPPASGGRPIWARAAGDHPRAARGDAGRDHRERLHAGRDDGEPGGYRGFRAWASR
jgi:formate dehydrogenase major subunit